MDEEKSIVTVQPRGMPAEGTGEKIGRPIASKG